MAQVSRLDYYDNPITTCVLREIVRTADEFNSRWQRHRIGYGGFSIGGSNISDLKKYLAIQKEHHRGKSFQEELVQFLKAYGIEYDERYLWN